jgi:hypothetical protein
MKQALEFLANNIKEGVGLFEFNLDGLEYIANGVWDVDVYIDENYNVDEYGNKYRVESITEQRWSWTGSLTEYRNGEKMRHIKGLRIFR